MKILITGYSGFIGNYLCNRLNQTEHELAFADFENGIDLCNWDQVKHFEHMDVIIHLANLSFVPASYQNPKLFYETNYMSTLNMLEICRLWGSKLIYFSSYMYGHPLYQPIDEGHALNAYNPYSQTKLICESLCEGYNRDFNVPITIFRPFNIYGKGQNPDFLIPSIINQAKNTKIVIRDDRPKRDYIHVEDIIEAVLKAIDVKVEGNQINKYNLGSGESHSVKEIIDIVCGFFDYEIEYLCTHEIRQNEVLDTIADISKIKKDLDWHPTISLTDGLRKMLAL